MKFLVSMLLALGLISAASAGATQAPRPGASFVITLLGSSRFQDIDVVLRGLRRSQEVQKAWESRATQGIIEISGTLKGDVARFRADLVSLVAERFTLESERQDDGGFHLTLRKKGDSPPF